MPLKYFHILFVTIASLVCFAVGVWAIKIQQLPGLAILGVAAGVVLIVYGIKFYGKIKALNI